jgi:hypothetical protein
VSAPDPTSGEADARGRRGQMVLLAAGVVAVALAAVLVAYLQLGYAGDAEAAREYTAPTANAERVLERAVQNASAGVPTEYDWDERSAAVDDVRTDLAGPLASLRSARLERGTAYRVVYNASAARAYAADACPGGPGREFGPCEADRGVVLQERAGDAHVVAVAVDLTVVGEDRRVETTLVVRAVGGIDRGRRP